MLTSWIRVTLDRPGLLARVRLSLIGFQVVAVQTLLAGAAIAGQTKTIQVGGQTRSYVVYKPGNFSGAAVIALHGQGMTAAQMEWVTRFDVEADANGFLAVYPQARNRNWATDDVAFIDALITRLDIDYKLDDRRIYVAGVSQGGKMAYRVACWLDERVAAVGVVAGTQPSEGCYPSGPISVVHVHGTKDYNVPWSTVPGTIAFWEASNGCRGANTMTYTSSGTSVARFSYTPCDDGTEVMLYAIEGGTHTWFGVRPYGKNAAVNATSTLWQFFEDHPK